MATEIKHETDHVEAVPGGQDHPYGFNASADTLPPGYWYSPKFVGTITATGLGVLIATGAFSFAAPNLELINKDIGPSKSVSWLSLIPTLTSAVGLLLVGRLSDLFGRRWFFIGSAVLSLVGAIVCSRAQTVNQLIGGVVLLGVASSGQLSFAFITGELVPVRYRFAANAIVYIFIVPAEGFSPLISKAFILYTAQGWRWCYYLLIILNAVDGLLFYFCYFPPTFEEKYRNRKPLQQLKDLDYVGIVLFTGGLIVFLLGLSWGGQTYAWKSAQVLVTLLVGFATLVAFVLWEIYAKLEEPLLPIYLFRNFKWVAVCSVLGLGASVFYGMSIIWPQMVATLYTDDRGASLYAGLLSCCPGAMINFGQIVGGFLAEPIGKTKIQTITVLTIGGALLAAVAAATPDTKFLATGLILVASFAIGWNESVALANSGIELMNQREIGTAIGAAGSLRSVISTVASAVYISVLNNRLSQTIPAVVPPAIEQAGLPESSVPGFLSGLTSGSFDGVAGVNDAIIAVGQRAYREASAQAFRTVFLTTLAFSGTAIILSFFSPNVDDKMTGEVAVTLGGAGQQPRDEKVVDTEEA